MKKIALLFLIASIPFLAIAQLTFDLKGTVIKKISSEINEGEMVELLEIKEEAIDNLTNYRAYLLCNNNIKVIDLKKLQNIQFIPSNIKEFWQNQALLNGIYINITKNGLQYKLRKELEEEAINYISFTENNNMIFKDSYLESYLYALSYKIYPIRLEDGRPGILNIKVLKSIVPNAFIFSNGTMFITTGLLSAINSEEELIAVMAHEISHFVLDHSIVNINNAKDRKNRADFWAALATGVAATADIYTAAKNEYYAPGAITMGTAILAYTIASELNERMGLKYSRGQEIEADQCATELMKYIKIDSTALSSALMKIKNYCVLNGNYHALTGDGTHPALDDRIKYIGKPTTEFYNSDYDKTISFVNSFNAIIEFNNYHLQSCSNLVNRNIKSNVATEDDYVLLAMVTTFLFDNEIKNKEALNYINIAKSLNISPSINISKQEAIILIRLGKFADAKNSLDNYLVALEKERLNLVNIKNTGEWSYINNYLFNEREWTVKMINKVNKM
ncbi:MAG: M48 family metalloprotease [Saprospiraceae bacterium]|nr:M48 family metalloprotease [Saprospiraceae bacterium]